MSCARSYRTLRDGSFEGIFPGTSCQATIGWSLRDRRDPKKTSRARDARVLREGEILRGTTQSRPYGPINHQIRAGHRPDPQREADALAGYRGLYLRPAENRP